MSDGIWDDPFPSVLRIGGRCVTINTDFRVGLSVRELWQDERIVLRERLGWELTFRLLFGEGPPDGACAAEYAKAVYWYLSDGRRRPPEKSGDAAGTGGGKKLFSCFWDAPLLDAAFRSAYGIDLFRIPAGRLHLWRFDALFSSLPADCALVRTIAVRAADLSAITDTEERARVAAEQVLHRIPPAGEMERILHLF